MPLTIDILSGYASPWTGTFDQDVVGIGRAPAAHVRLHAVKDNICASGVHARLVREHAPDGDGGSAPVYTLHVDHDNGVTLERGTDAPRFIAKDQSVRLAHGDALTLGKSGPRLAVSIIAGGALPRTYHEGRPTVSLAPGPLPEARVTHEHLVMGRLSMRTARRLAALLLALIIIVGIGGYLLWQQWRATSEQTSTLERLVEERTRRRGTGTDEEVARVLQKARASVCLIGSVNAAGVFDGFGTGWTVAPGKIATNAHVADAARMRRDWSGHTIVARRGPGLDVELKIGAITKHPGYGPWSERLEEVAKRTQDTVGFKPIAVCDVAIMEVTEGDAGEPLPLADPRTEAIRVGDAVGYAGFPMEEVSGVASMQAPVGRVSATTDVFFGSSEVADDVLIHHTVFSVGGSSGSPLLNARGRVIGLVSAGSIVRSPSLLAEGKRVPLGLNYAQRVDLLRELLDGTAEESQKARDARWQARADAMVPTVAQRLDRIAAEYAASAITLELVEEHAERLSEPDEAGGFDRSFEAEQDAEYFACAVADDFSPLSLKSTNAAGEERLDDRAVPSAEVSVAATDMPGTRSTVKVWAAVLRSDKPLVTVRVYRLKP